MTFTQKQYQAALAKFPLFQIDDVLRFWQNHEEEIKSAISAMADPMWQLVPVEPTNIQLANAGIGFTGAIDRSGINANVVMPPHPMVAKMAYQAMLDSAPTYAAPKEGG